MPGVTAASWSCFDVCEVPPEVDEDVDDEHDVHDEVDHVEGGTGVDAALRGGVLLRTWSTDTPGDSRAEDSAPNNKTFNVPLMSRPQTGHQSPAHFQLYWFRTCPITDLGPFHRPDPAHNLVLTSVWPLPGNNKTLPMVKLRRILHFLLVLLRERNSLKLKCLWCDCAMLSIALGCIHPLNVHIPKLAHP